MSSTKITLYGMYRYMRDMDDDLFSGFSLPEGINRETAINTILLSGGEYEVIYPDPDFMKFSIHTWSDKWYHTISRWFAAISKDYDPLINYDRTEEQLRTPDLETKRTADLEDKRTADLEDKRTPDLETKRTPDLTDERTPDLTYERTPDLLDTNAGTVTEETQRSAYDSSSYEPDEKRTTTPENTIATTGTDTNTETGTETTTHTGTDTTTETGTDTTTHTGTDTMKHTGTDTTTETGTEKTEIRAFGNIGVTTSQQMLEAEIKVAEWSLYDSIARLFLQEYVIPVMV